MNDADRERYLLRAAFPIYRHRVEKAKKLIAAALETAPRWYAACSFGKDSLCLLHLVHDIDPRIPAVFIDSGDDISLTPADRERVMAWCAESGVNLVVIPFDKMSVYAPEKNYTPGKAIHADMFKPLAGWLKDHPHDGVFMGLRKDESSARSFALWKYGALHQYESGWQKGAWRSAPLMDWKTEDCATYMLQNRLPMLDIYDRMGFEARSGLFGMTSAQFGRVAYLRRYFPDVYAKFEAIMPEIRQYV